MTRHTVSFRALMFKESLHDSRGIGSMIATETDLGNVARLIRNPPEAARSRETLDDNIAYWTYCYSVYSKVTGYIRSVAKERVRR